MANEATKEDEPSIEEILDSIRQIISEEDNESSMDDDSSVEDVSDTLDEPVPEPMESVEKEPLDQSAIDDIDFDAPMAEESETVSVDVEEEPTEEEEEIIDLTEPVEEDIEVDLTDSAEEETEPEPVTLEEAEPEVVATKEDDSLLTNAAEKAAVSAITELVRKTAVEHNGITLEEIVRTELKPLLKDWLDKNLPTVIERLVQEELERVSRRVLEE